jgi:hypothetical protein
VDDFKERVFLLATKIAKNSKIPPKDSHYFVPFSPSNR